MDSLSVGNYNPITTQLQHLLLKLSDVAFLDSFIAKGQILTNSESSGKMDSNNGVITDNVSFDNFDAMRDDVHLMRRLGGDPKKAEERKLAELAVTKQSATQRDEILLQQTKANLEIQRQRELRLRTALNGDSYTGRALETLLFIASLVTVVLALLIITMFHYLPFQRF